MAASMPVTYQHFAPEPKSIQFHALPHHIFLIDYDLFGADTASDRGLCIGGDVSSSHMESRADRQNEDMEKIFLAAASGSSVLFMPRDRTFVSCVRVCVCPAPFIIPYYLS